jgi:hypothetical protein
MRRFPGWLRYRRFYRALVVDAARNRQPLDRSARAALKDQARTAAKATGRRA